MQDYVTPLEQLLALLSAAVSTGKQLTYEQVHLTFHITHTVHHAVCSACPLSASTFSIDIDSSCGLNALV